MHVYMCVCMHARACGCAFVCAFMTSLTNSSGVSPTLEELVDVRIFPLVEAANLSELSFTRYFMLLDDGMNRAGLIETCLLGS